MEIALVLPVMFLLLIGGFDFARAYKYGLALNDAAFQGARLGSNPITTNGAIRNAVRADLPGELQPTDAQITITPAARFSGNTIRVEVVWTYAPLFPGSAPFFPSGVPLRGIGSTVVR